MTRAELAIAVWESLDCESVGAAELTQIREAVSDRFGAGAVESPAALARILADEGAVLRHPEVIECDAAWRAKQLAGSESNDWSSLADAAEAILGLEELRQEITDDRARLRELTDRAIQIRQDRLMMSESPVLSEAERAEATEIAAWLEVWLRSPDLFSDWLALRLTTSEFRRLFGVPPPKS